METLQCVVHVYCVCVEQRLAEEKRQWLEIESKRMEEEKEEQTPILARRAKQMAAAEANMCPEHKKFNAILCNTVFINAIGAMKDKLIDIHTLWWIVQWGKEYVAKFEAAATKDEIDSLEKFKLWTRTQKKKQDYGFYASMPKKGQKSGDDSFQSP